LQAFCIFMQQHNAGSQIPGPHIAPLHFGQGSFRIFCHEQGIPVGTGTGIVKELIQKAVHLLPPAFAVGIDFFGRIILV